MREVVGLSRKFVLMTVFVGQTKCSQNRQGDYGMLALSSIAKHCPNIPAPKVKGWCERKLDHYFTEWIEGKTLADWVIEKDPHSAKIKIPRKMVNSLAEFVYNLTTCPIPKAESTNMFDKGPDIL